MTRLPGSSNLYEKCLDAVRRSPGVPAGIVAVRLGRSYGTIESMLRRLVERGVLLTHIEKDPESNYLGRRVYYLPEKRA